MTKNIIIIHHTAVSYTKNANQFDAVNRYHVGKGWGSIGYHYFIEKDGTIKEGRKESQIGAHTYQQDMNYKSLGICLCGHFDEEDPTNEQLHSLQALVNKVGKIRVYAHRKFAPYKSCPGGNFTDLMISKLENNKLLINNSNMKLTGNETNAVQAVVYALKNLWEITNANVVLKKEGGGKGLMDESNKMANDLRHILDDHE